MTATTIRVQMAQRKDTAANWTAANPILLSGEIGYETDTKKFKIGNGSTNWNSLAYLPIPDGSGNLTITGNLEIGSTGSLTFEGSTADGFETTLAVTNPTADRTITLPNQSGTVLVSGNASIVDADIAANAEIAVSKLADGTARQLLQTDAAGTGVEWTSNVDIPGTLDVTGAATFDAAVTVAGDLTVNGTTTTISTQNLLVEDKNIIIGDVASPTDVTADGGGITLKGATDKTINWVDATDAWTSSERFSVPLGSAASPSLTFTGDPNTGIYSPGADQVAISTGGTQKLAIDSSGNVSLTGPNLSIGGAAPSNAGYSNLYVNNTSGAQLFLSVNGSNSRVIYSTATDLNYYISDSSPHIWFTNAGERMRLDASGRLGIGTSSPGRNLHVAGSSATALIESTGSTNADLLIGDGGVRYYGIRGVAGGGSLQIRNDTANTTLATFTSTGLVGIGSTSPQSILHLAGTSPQLILDPGSGSTDPVSINSWRTNAPIVFKPGDAERVRIDGSGRLLVGTSTGPSDSTLVLQGNSSNSTYNSVLRMLRNVTNPAADAVLGSIIFGVDNAASSGIECYTDGQWGTNDYPGRLVFSTTADGESSPTERMRISSTGNAYIVSTANALAITTTLGANGSNYFLRGLYSGTAGSAESGTTSFYVYTNGNVQNTNNSYGAISDVKLKENIVDATSQWSDIKALQVRKYNFKEGQTHTQIGLVAQEVEQVSPGLVTESPDRDAEGNDLGTVTKSVNYSVLYMKAVKALQEAMERIETLEARLTAAGI